MTTEVSVRRGQYRDSVTLMQLSRDLAGVDGVETAFVAMATELNLDLLALMGFDRPAECTVNDMVVALRADGPALVAANARFAELLAARATASAGDEADVAPRTVRSAARRLDTASIALLSMPGPHVLPEAMDALEAGLSVMIFSDNVPLEHEVRLKEVAGDRGLLVMGPDCGTAVISGVGLGFANVVRPGPVGIVAASGTGAQQLMCLLDDAGVGVAHCLGVGGRDLSEAVGGRSTHQALDFLAADPATEIVVVISKPPAPTVAALIAEHAAAIQKPVVLAFLGPGQPDLTTAAAEIVRTTGGMWTDPRWWPAPVERNGHYPFIRGLFSGGTLCDEAMVIASAALGPVASNIPLDVAWALDDDLRGTAHLMIDFGDDRLTRGRPHPMIDPSLRLARLAVEAGDSTCGVLLLDVVLGHAAHPDPADALAPAIREAHAVANAAGRDLAVVVALVGSVGDPQGRDRQAEMICAAGASVHLSNAAAARKAVELVAPV